MQLLTEVIDVNELYRLKMLFESNGIAIFISNEDAARNFGFIYPARKYGIFAVYEDQYQDAVALLNDENHVVENPMDLSEHREFIEAQGAQSSRTIFNVMMNVIVVTVCVVGAIIFYAAVTSH